MAYSKTISLSSSSSTTRTIHHPMTNRQFLEDCHSSTQSLHLPDLIYESSSSSSGSSSPSSTRSSHYHHHQHQYHHHSSSHHNDASVTLSSSFLDRSLTSDEEERMAARDTAALSVRSLLESLSDAVKSSSSSPNDPNDHIKLLLRKVFIEDDCDYVDILTTAQKYVNKLCSIKIGNDNEEEEEDDETTNNNKRSLVEAMTRAWKDVATFLYLQHRDAVRKYRKQRKELENYHPPSSDPFVHPEVYTKLRQIKELKVHKALSYVNVVAELHCASLKGITIHENLQRRLLSSSSSSSFSYVR